MLERYESEIDPDCENPGLWRPFPALSEGMPVFFQASFESCLKTVSVFSSTIGRKKLLLEQISFQTIHPNEFRTVLWLVMQGFSYGVGSLILK